MEAFYITDALMTVIVIGGSCFLLLVTAAVGEWILPKISSEYNKDDDFEE